MRRTLFFSALVITATATRAEAANLAVITNPPTMLNVLVLFCAAACVGGAYKVLGLVRGGRLSGGWLVFMSGFALLAVNQIILLCQTFEIVTLPEFVVPALFVVVVGLFLYGVLEVKRTLS